MNHSSKPRTLKISTLNKCSTLVIPVYINSLVVLNFYLYLYHGFNYNWLKLHFLFYSSNNCSSKIRKVIYDFKSPLDIFVLQSKNALLLRLKFSHSRVSSNTSSYIYIYIYLFIKVWNQNMNTIIISFPLKANLSNETSWY